MYCFYIDKKYVPIHCRRNDTNRCLVGKLRVGETNVGEVSVYLVHVASVNRLSAILLIFLGKFKVE